MIRACARLSARHRVQAPCLGFEFLSRLLNSAAFVWRLDGTKPHSLFDGLVDVPACWLGRFGRFLRHAATSAPPACAGNPSRPPGTRGARSQYAELSARP